jgi:hypothetical protein
MMRGGKRAIPGRLVAAHNVRFAFKACSAALRRRFALPHGLGVTGANQIGHMIMKIERFAGHHEAREALVLSVAGVTAIMLIESLILLILF